MGQVDHELHRRGFLGRMAAAGAALTSAPLAAAEVPPAAATIDRKINSGIVGCGGRGRWIANLFKNHGGYQFTAAADYHQNRAASTGKALGVDAAKCFSGLSGYKRLIDSGVEAVIIEDVPCFYPEQAEAAVQAGLHVYMAKPVAVDVPGTLKIGELAKTCTEKKQVFLVDYQIPTDPFNLEVYKRVREGGLGTLQMVFSVGTSGGSGFSDPPLTANVESRLTGLVWVNDDALGCGYIGNYDIHIIDAIVWALGRRPVSAYAKGGRFRANPHGDTFDTNFVTYTFEDGLAWNHHSATGPTHDWLKQDNLECSIQGSAGAARLSYWGKSYVRGGPKNYEGGTVANLYDQGALRNIAAFYEKIVGGDAANETALRSVDTTLTCILGREASRRGGLLTMDELIKENKRLEVDLKGLKV